MLTDKQPSRPSTATYFRFMEILIPKWNVQTRILEEGGMLKLQTTSLSGDLFTLIIRDIYLVWHSVQEFKISFCLRTNAVEF